MKDNMMVELVNTTTINDLPEGLTRHIKEQILDTLGFSIAGVQKKSGQERIRRTTSWSHTEEASIIGNSAKVSAMDAFRTNSYSSRLGEFGNAFYHIPRHLGALVVNSALAAGGKLDASIGDVTVATFLTYELLMQGMHITWEVVWPENEREPNAKAIPYLDVAPIASILYGLLSSRKNNGLTTIAAVVMGAMAILQWGIKKELRETMEKLVIVDQISTSLDKSEYLAGVRRQSLTETEGMMPKLKDYFLLHNLLALEKAIYSISRYPGYIENMVLVFPIGLDHILSENVDEIKTRIATAAVLYIARAESKQSWYLTKIRTSKVVSRMAEKIKFAGDIEGYFEDNSKGLPFRAQVEASGRIHTGHVICPFLALRELDNRNTAAWFKTNTIPLIGEEQSSELYQTLMSDDSMLVAELLKLTCPVKRKLAILQKIGLFKYSSGN